MELIYLNKKLDTNLEHELISENEFGFNVLIVYTEDSWYIVTGKQIGRAHV